LGVEEKIMSEIRIQNRLWSARKATGLTQYQVARLLGYKTSTQISRWEKGLQMPSVVDLMKLSAIYRRLANDLMFDLYHSVKTEIDQQIRKNNPDLF
jgi:transcriptional regulator with XRE-family HTH domain